MLENRNQTLMDGQETDRRTFKGENNTPPLSCDGYKKQGINKLSSMLLFPTLYLVIVKAFIKSEDPHFHRS